MITHILIVDADCIAARVTAASISGSTTTSGSGDRRTTRIRSRRAGGARPVPTIELKVTDQLAQSLRGSTERWRCLLVAIPTTIVTRVRVERVCLARWNSAATSDENRTPSDAG